METVSAIDSPCYVIRIVIISINGSIDQWVLYMPERLETSEKWSQDVAKAPKSLDDCFKEC